MTDLAAAVEALRQEPGLSYGRAARRYGVPTETLRQAAIQIGVRALGRPTRVAKDTAALEVALDALVEDSALTIAEASRRFGVALSTLDKAALQRGVRLRVGPGRRPERRAWPAAAAPWVIAQAAARGLMVARPTLAALALAERRALQVDEERGDDHGEAWQENTMSKTPCKQAVYLPEDILAEIQREASRQERTLSWLVQKAWVIAKKQIRAAPGGAPEAADTTCGSAS